MKIMYRLFADTIWLFHFVVVAIALFGWIIPQIWYLYMCVLASVLTSNILLDYCFLSKWEFDLRKKTSPSLSYDFTYTSYYTYNLTKGYLSKNFLRWTGLGFTSLSLAINLYFVYFY
ncbi:MAG: DUF2784 family protein [Candidatus Pacebacteria bacterium]|nr:DUF2784 family protein [Candidatus Paceibacterota bacterium]